jgi:hypothetical protein
MMFTVLVCAVAAYPPRYAEEYQKFLTPKGDSYLGNPRAPSPVSSFPKILAQQPLVNNLISKINPDLVKKHLVRLTEFPERYMDSNNGDLAARWLMDEVISLNSSVSSEVLLTVKLVYHKNARGVLRWKQPSVIARLESKKRAATDIVITGTHFDTRGDDVLTGRTQEPMPNPGADDCASGSSVIAETLRLLVQSKFVPLRPIEVFSISYL